MILKIPRRKIMILQNISEKSTGILRKYREKIEKNQAEKAFLKKKAFFREVLNEAKKDVLSKRNHFENVTEEKLLNCCILELTAAEARLNYYISLARKENMVNDEYLDYVFKRDTFEGSVIM
ncbi:MAG: DUF2508 family protein [Ruminococcaceae bacterium]|nr:DUF2508 family protein [Oscillospiraceae bacterium]